MATDRTPEPDWPDVFPWALAALTVGTVVLALALRAVGP